MCRIDCALSTVAGQLLRTRGVLGRSQERVALDAEIAVRTYRRLEAGSGNSSLGSLLRAMRALDLESLCISPARVWPPSRIAELPAPSARCATCGTMVRSQRPWS